MAEFTFKCGTTVNLARLNRRVVNSIFAPFGGLSNAMNLTEQDLEEMTADERREFSVINSRFFQYCAGWGVEDDPPRKARKTLSALHFDKENEHIYRAAWVQFCLLDNDNFDDEGGKFIGAVLGYTYLDRE